MKTTVYDAVYGVLLSVKELFGGEPPTREEALELQAEYIMTYAAQGFPYGNNDAGLVQFVQETKFEIGEEP